MPIIISTTINNNVLFWAILPYINESYVDTGSFGKDPHGIIGIKRLLAIHGNHVILMVTNEIMGIMHENEIIMPSSAEIFENNHPSNYTELSKIIATSAVIFPSASCLSEEYTFVIGSAIKKLFSQPGMESLPKGFKFRIKECDFNKQPTAYIDGGTIERLQLDTLLHSLNTCKTQMGKKMLRSSVFSPLCDVGLLRERQNGVEEYLSEKLELGEKMAAEVSKINIKSHIMIAQGLGKKSDDSKCLCVEGIVHLLRILRNLMGNSTECNSKVLGKLVEYINCAGMRSLETTLEKIIRPSGQKIYVLPSSNFKLCHLDDLTDEDGNESPHIPLYDWITDGIDCGEEVKRHFNKLLIVRIGKNGRLDLLRSLYFKTMSKILIEAKKYKSRIRLKHNFQGFHFEIRCIKIPQGAISIKSCKTGYSKFITPALHKLNFHANDITKEIIKLTSTELTGALQHIKRSYEVLSRCCEAIGYVDMICALGRFSKRIGGTRPSIGNILVIDQLRQIPIEKTSTSPNSLGDSSDSFLPMDVWSVVGEHVHLITGPNGSGKSTYLRQIAYIQILAQVGCHIPAKAASISIVQRLFYYSPGAKESDGNSTFMQEMREIGMVLGDLDIISNAATDTETTLNAPYSINRYNLSASIMILLDDFARGTASQDSIALSISLAEYVAKRPSATLFLTTHYQQVLIQTYGIPGVLIEFINNYHVQEKRLTKREMCLNPALCASMPAAILQYSRDLYDQIIGDGKIEDNILMSAQLEMFQEKRRIVYILKIMYGAYPQLDTKKLLVQTNAIRKMITKRKTDFSKVLA